MTQLLLEPFALIRWACREQLSGEFLEVLAQWLRIDQVELGQQVQLLQGVIDVVGCRILGVSGGDLFVYPCLNLRNHQRSRLLHDEENRVGHHHRRHLVAEVTLNFLDSAYELGGEARLTHSVDSRTKHINKSKSGPEERSVKLLA